jgi:hypothetical protein
VRINYLKVGDEMATYNIKHMRVTRPSEKMAEKHPDRFITIFGEFFTDKGAKMTITQKVVTKTEAKSAEFSIDINKGILTLPDVSRGRKAFEGITQDDIQKDLAALRK